APLDTAKKDENRMKNRYGNIIASSGWREWLRLHQCQLHRWLPPTKPLHRYTRSHARRLCMIFGGWFGKRTLLPLSW
ncbi:unnamed protein product, partial [Tetraodon nigroviridis]